MAKNSADQTGPWKYRRSVAWRKVADEAIILDVDSAQYYSLKDAGLRIWELLGKKKTVPQIAKALAAEYDAAESRLLADCADVVCRLRKEGLIERA